MKRIMTVILVLGSLVVTACTKPGGDGAVQAGGETPAPAPRADARPASVGGIFKGTVNGARTFGVGACAASIDQNLGAWSATGFA